MESFFGDSKSYFIEPRPEPRPITEEQGFDVRSKTVQRYQRLISMVSMGNWDKTDPTHKVSSEVRQRILKEKDMTCEGCLVVFDSPKLHVHHTNYFRPDDFETLRLLCLRCHAIVTRFADMMRQDDAEEINKLRWPNGKPKPLIHR